jgi:hypothetical protein
MVKWVFKAYAVDNVNWIQLHHYEGLWQAFTNTILNLRIPYMWGLPEELSHHHHPKKHFALCSLLAM